MSWSFTDNRDSSARPVSSLNACVSDSVRITALPEQAPDDEAVPTDIEPAAVGKDCTGAQTRIVPTRSGVVTFPWSRFGAEGCVLPLGNTSTTNGSSEAPTASLPPHFTVLRYGSACASVSAPERTPFLYL